MFNAQALRNRTIAPNPYDGIEDRDTIRAIVFCETHIEEDMVTASDFGQRDTTCLIPLEVNVEKVIGYLSDLGYQVEHIGYRKICIKW